MTVAVSRFTIPAIYIFMGFNNRCICIWSSQTKLGLFTCFFSGHLCTFHCLYLKENDIILFAKHYKSNDPCVRCVTQRLPAAFNLNWKLFFKIYTGTTILLLRIVNSKCLQQILHFLNSETSFFKYLTYMKSNGHHQNTGRM